MAETPRMNPPQSLFILLFIKWGNKFCFPNFTAFPHEEVSIRFEVLKLFHFSLFVAIPVAFLLSTRRAGLGRPQRASQLLVLPDALPGGGCG